MPVSAGDRLGPYEILGPLGVGGMGEVYRARDSRLHREVAIKISKEKFSDRFDREARAIAALNHPNICHLYDVGPNYLVMELVEGPTLAERLKRGAVPLEEALVIAHQVAEALEAAHEKNIIHRDLKPGNIKIKPDGMVKVLDFGLAKVGGAPVVQTEDSPTVTLGHVELAETEAGVILGTAAYMSPEQARGKAVDKRADIWAFGVVLFEMLTGRRLFKGEESSDILASVIKDEPDFSQVPSEARAVLRRCLEKDPKRRLRDIADAMALLEDSAEGNQAITGRSSAWSRPLPWIALAVALLVIAGLAIWAVRRGPFAERRALYVQLAPPEGSDFATFGAGAGGFALSPDGKAVAFIAKTEGKNGLWVRQVDRPMARLLPGTEGAGTPIWSPDSKSIAFTLDRKLQRVELSGGAPLTICDECGGIGGDGAWTSDGRIIFAGQGLRTVSASGGTVSDFGKLDESRGEIQYRYPQIISKDRFMYWARNKKIEDSGVYLASLSNPADRVKVLTNISNAVYAADNSGKGYLLYIRGATLMAQEFDASARKLSGEPRAIADSVAYTGTLGHAEVSASTAGSLLYTSPIRYQFTWFDRSGKPLSKVGDLGEYITFRLSPDGHRIIASRDLPGGTDLWLLDVDRGSASQLTFTGTYHFPVWSPDSKTIIFRSFADYQNLFRKNSNGATGEERIEFSTQRGHTALDWSRDGRFLLYNDGGDLWVAPVFPDGSLAGKPTAYFVMRPFGSLAARFSPELTPHWVAYQSNESGRWEIYLQAFPHPKGKIEISTDGGRMPEWSPDGREIFYLSPDYNLMAVSLRISGDAVGPSAPRELFHLPAMDLASGISPYAVADAQKFLVRVTPQQFINLIVDWPALLNRRGTAQ